MTEMLFVVSYSDAGLASPINYVLYGFIADIINDSQKFSSLYIITDLFFILAWLSDRTLCGLVYSIIRKQRRTSRYLRYPSNHNPDPDFHHPA